MSPTDRDPASPGAPLDTRLARAADVVRELGFSIVTGGDAGDPAATDLVVALRDEPTLRHFDPEVVSYWVPQEGRGRPRELTRESHLPLEGRFAWGRLWIADRLGLTNQWLTFGGALRAAALDPATTIVEFSSPAPIQRWSGHSQGLDLLTPEMGAFFGRLMIPIDFEPGAESRVVDADPAVLYAAFIHDARGRTVASDRLAVADRQLTSHVAREARRLEETDPDAWREGGELLTALGLGRVG